MAFKWDILHPSKHVPLLYTFVLLGENLTGAAFKFCAAATQGGSALVTLNAAAAGSEGVSVAYDAAYVHPATGVAVGASTMTAQLNEVTIEALTFGAAPADLVLAYDFLITPSGGVQRVHAYGALTIQQGIGD